MNTQYLSSVLFACIGMVCVAPGQSQSHLFKDAVHATGYAYRQVITNLLASQNVAEQLDAVTKNMAADNADVRQARIVLARLQYPNVFVGYEELIMKYRKAFPRGERSGYLSGTILGFTRQGPESKYVDEKVGRKTWDVVGSATNRIRWGDAVYKKVEKYTDADVRAGIARNAAARQAVLEHFLKFLDEGDAYEQSEMVNLVNRLWGRERIKRTEDLAVVDNVPDADALIEAVFKDGSRPEAARMSAAYCLPDSKRLAVRAFMIGVVTNNPADHKQNYDVVDRALVYLESGADANELAVLKSQTNAPAWKRDKITKTSRAIETRLSAASHGK